MAEYRNPWHKPGRAEYGPPVYVANVEAMPYGGFLIYHRQGAVWDVVKDGECITQRAGLGGAKAWIDAQ
jgi:hypothetical protein